LEILESNYEKKLWRLQSIITWILDPLKYNGVLFDKIIKLLLKYRPPIQQLSMGYIHIYVYKLILILDVSYENYPS